MKMNSRRPKKFVTSRPGFWDAIPAVALLVVILGFSGCPATEYDQGFDDGFAKDALYFQGFDDSWETVGPGPILYDGSSIPFIDGDTYEAGYQEGLWFAYNDGYFVAYRYAFIIGFSEGYDSAFHSAFLDFLGGDTHVEFLHGGFSDGYNDGFSEGRIFGAFDYEAGLPFDWLDAFLDWENGTDLFFEEVPVGTGLFGPVTLYEWGIDPATGKSKIGGRMGHLRQSVMGRKGFGPKAGILLIDIARPLTGTQQSALRVTPASTTRAGRPLRLETTWLERIEAYLAAWGVAPKRARGA